MTIEDRDDNGDHAIAVRGGYAIVKAEPGVDVPDLMTAGLLDEGPRVAKTRPGPPGDGFSVSRR